MRFQRVIQTISLLIFLGLLMMAAHPYQEGLAADLFLSPVLTLHPGIHAFGLYPDSKWDAMTNGNHICYVFHTTPQL